MLDQAFDLSDETTNPLSARSVIDVLCYNIGSNLTVGLPDSLSGIIAKNCEWGTLDLRNNVPFISVISRCVSAIICARCWAVSGCLVTITERSTSLLAKSRSAFNDRGSRSAP